jgi:hypothetical protein
MRYEHIELDLTTAACAALLTMLKRGDPLGEAWSDHTATEMINLRSELEARLQRRDQDPKATDPLMR